MIDMNIPDHVPDPDPSPIPSEGTEIHLQYGLRITHFCRRISNRTLNRIRPRKFGFYSLCHLLEGNGWYWSPEKGVVEVNPGDGVLAKPGTIMDYGGIDNSWVEDYVCFIGPVADHLAESGVVADGVIKLGRERRLLPIIEAALEPGDEAQIAANSLLQKLLVDLYLERRQEEANEKNNAIVNLRRVLTAEATRWWTVREMADLCGMSVNHFRNCFRQETGQNPKAYLDHLKMNRASEELCSSRLSVIEIAERYGYRDPYHFSRAFKRIIGLSPENFRKACHTNP